MERGLEEGQIDWRGELTEARVRIRAITTPVPQLRLGARAREKEGKREREKSELGALMKRSNHLSRPVYISGALQDDTVLFARRRYGFYGPLEGVLSTTNEMRSVSVPCSPIRILRDGLRSFVTRDRYLLDGSRTGKKHY